jgi:hypothetical protein
MTILSSLSRRTFLASQAALATLAGLTGAASAATSAPATLDDAALGPATGPVRWDTATADQLEQFIGDRFRVRSREHGDFVLRLVEVEPIRSGPHRPAHLRRSEGSVAVFDSPDGPELAAYGDQILRLSHARLGQAELFMGPTPLRNGRQVLEAVLN